ncbi:MAG: class II glutamine amidotransferase [bacterium]
MCQLLGMNCNVPTDICFSFTGFCERGGRTGEHTDGWGIGFFEGKGCRIFLDTTASAESQIAAFVQSYPIKTLNAIAHIRKATIGSTALENTHPYTRELWGHNWLFAHNGNLKEFAPTFKGLYLPVGSTDSETAFCLIMENLRKKFRSTFPTTEELFNAIHSSTKKIAKHGIFNFLLGNENLLFAHCYNNLHYIIRQAPFAKAQLKDTDVTIDFSTVTTTKDRVALIATEPLTTNETWTKIPPGTLLLFQNGTLIKQSPTIQVPL